MWVKVVQKQKKTLVLMFLQPLDRVDTYLAGLPFNNTGCFRAFVELVVITVKTLVKAEPCVHNKAANDGSSHKAFAF